VSSGKSEIALMAQFGEIRRIQVGRSAVGRQRRDCQVGPGP